MTYNGILQTTSKKPKSYSILSISSTSCLRESLNYARYFRLSCDWGVLMKGSVLWRLQIFIPGKRKGSILVKLLDSLLLYLLINMISHMTTMEKAKHKEQSIP